MDLQHLPLTDIAVPGVLFGIPILGIYYIAFAVFGVYTYFSYVNTKRKYGKYLYTKHGYILIGGKFENGKTRLLAQFASELYEKPDTFVLSNYYNGYSFISWSSFADFVNILDDLLLLGEYQNFNNTEAKEIQEKFPNYFSEDERNSMKKYKYIPSSGKHCDFIMEGDEFHQYLYSRNSMSNFGGDDGEKLLQTMHQVRHYNLLCILATQDLDDLDNKLRKLASYEIDTLNFFGVVFGYNFFLYELNKRKTQREDDKREFRKINKFPILFLNGYSLNHIIDDMENLWNKWDKKTMNKWNKVFGKNYIFYPVVFKRFKALDFQSKFNVKIQKSIYEKGDLFRKLNEHYKKI